MNNIVSQELAAYCSLVESMLSHPEKIFKDSLISVCMKALVRISFMDGKWQDVLLSRKTSKAINAQIEFLKSATVPKFSVDTLFTLWYSVYSKNVQAENGVLVCEKLCYENIKLPELQRFQTDIDGIDKALLMQRDTLFCLIATQHADYCSIPLSSTFKQLCPTIKFDVIFEGLVPLMGRMKGIDIIAEVGALMPHLLIDFDVPKLTEWTERLIKTYYPNVNAVIPTKATSDDLIQEIKNDRAQYGRLLRTAGECALKVTASDISLDVENGGVRKRQLRDILERLKEDIRLLTSAQLDEVDVLKKKSEEYRALFAQRADMLNRINYEKLVMTPQLQWTPSAVPSNTMVGLDNDIAKLSDVIEKLRAFVSSN